jgi:hypothetical protein
VRATCSVDQVRLQASTDFWARCPGSQAIARRKDRSLPKLVAPDRFTNNQEPGNHGLPRDNRHSNSAYRCACLWQPIHRCSSSPDSSILGATMYPSGADLVAKFQSCAPKFATEVNISNCTSSLEISCQMSKYALIGLHPHLLYTPRSKSRNVEASGYNPRFLALRYTPILYTLPCSNPRMWKPRVILPCGCRPINAVCASVSGPRPKSAISLVS